MFCAKFWCKKFEFCTYVTNLKVFAFVVGKLFESIFWCIRDPSGQTFPYTHVVQEC